MFLGDAHWQPYAEADSDGSSQAVWSALSPNVLTGSRAAFKPVGAIALVLLMKYFH